ncbi:hypothetical protein SAMD00019534_024650, partial [Acytostelium subglobosum LB1]|uniref:hypothetical protein n=1 Tax=Acytostelium subglobosum LB1 TaxID=1410327 RepID=UPI000644BFEC
FNQDIKIQLVNSFGSDSSYHHNNNNNRSNNNNNIINHRNIFSSSNNLNNSNSNNLVNNNININISNNNNNSTTTNISPSGYHIKKLKHNSHSPHTSRSDMVANRFEQSSWMNCEGDSVKQYNNVCTKVTDYLYMGSQRIASELQTLQSFGITHIINASVECENYFEDHPDHPFVYKKFPLRDESSEDIGAVFSSVIAFIEEARSRQGKVFVHCQMGVSRSPCLCILWLMHNDRLTLQLATSYIRDIRPISRPNFGFVLSLMNWASKEGLKGESETNSSSSSPVPFANVEDNTCLSAPSSPSLSLSNVSSPITSPPVSSPHILPLSFEVLTVKTPPSFSSQPINPISDPSDFLSCKLDEHHHNLSTTSTTTTTTTSISSKE